ncbi:MAG: hypothetical protein AAF799_09420 [Myxococcota bacterium]
MPRVLGVFGSMVLFGSSVAHADEPVVQRQAWSGHLGFFATGAPLAIDGPDADTTSVDQLAQPASIQLTPADLPPGAQLTAAYLYWGGSIANSECTVVGDIDDEVDFSAPDSAVLSVVADECFCSVAGSMAYDVQLCRSDVTASILSLEGEYSVSELDVLISNETTHHASFSLVVVYWAPGLPPRRVALYDGLLTMANDTNVEEVITLGGLDIDDPAVGDLTWYVLEGDVGGSSGEGAEVTGLPGGGQLVLADAVNPAGNPMNHTINTTSPIQTESLGVDIDRFEIDAALDPADDAVQLRFTAGIDKWWLAYGIVGVNVFEPVLADLSGKGWTLEDDADGDGSPSGGDTIRFTIRLNNTGNADAMVTVVDPIPLEALSWALVDAAGGTDASAGNTLIVEDIPVAVGGEVDVTVDVVLDDVPPGTEVVNVADYVAQPGGAAGTLVAPAVVVGEATAGDSTGADSTGDDGAADTTGAGTTAGSGSGGATGLGDETGSTPPPGVETSATPGTGATGVGGSSGGATDGSGCGCGTRGHGAPGWAWALMALWAAAARRRRPSAVRA